MTRVLSVLPVLILALVGSTFAQSPGDEWVTRRGDETPGLLYEAAVTARNGRTIALNQGGGLMMSEDGGSSWRFGRIEIGGLPVKGTFTALYEVPGGSLIAIMKRLEESTEGFYKYVVRTYFVTSGDYGNTWSMELFPVQFATFPPTGGIFYGVDIENLHMGPGGELLAYGTTSGTNQPGIVLWSTGGTIFRQSGNTWVQAHFGHGPVGKIADAGGRAVAAVFNGVLDSADGAGWNGYTFSQAQFTLDGEPMDFDTQYRMRVLDIEVLNDTYVAQGATFLPFRNIPGVDSNISDGVFKLVSPTPFSGARNWSAFSQPTYYGPFTKAGGQILSASPRGVYSTGSAVDGFTLRDETVRTLGRSLAVSGETTIVAVGDSESAWRSIDGGGSWNKVWDKDPGPDLRPIATIGGKVFAKGDGNELWTSRDGAESWQLNEGEFIGSGPIFSSSDGNLFTAYSVMVQVSRDGGETWEVRPRDESLNGFLQVLQLSSGRLLATARGTDVRGRGKFYLSDDEGETWRETDAGQGFNDDIAEAVQTPTGRIIVPTSANFPFSPRLTISDDDGETWRTSHALRRVTGLGQDGDPTRETTIEPKDVRVSTSGRIIIMSDKEIITSDDDGVSWTTRRRAVGAATPDLFERYSLQDLIQVGSRWIAIGSYQRKLRTERLLLVSDDDGTTWGQRFFESRQSTTSLRNIALAGGGRVIITATNGAVFTSDFAVPLPIESPEHEVREGNSGSVSIPRPDIDGIAEVRFGTISRTAVAETDFVPVGGILTWAADDVADKAISIDTIDNQTQNGEREFVLQLTFETADGLLGNIETPVAIIDDDGPSNPELLFENEGPYRTSEAGGTAEIQISLRRRPSQDVVLTFNGLDPTEGQLSATTLTFTPENFKVIQTVTLTGIDDSYPDGDATYEIRIAIETGDGLYRDLGQTVLSITNVGEEPYIFGGEYFERLGQAYVDWVAANNIPVEQSGPFSDPNGDGIRNLAAYAFGIAPLGSTAGSSLIITPERTVTFRASDAAENLTFISEVGTSLKLTEWVPGPAPVAGASSGGFTTYTVALPSDSATNFARVIVGIAE